MLKALAFHLQQKVYFEKLSLDKFTIQENPRRLKFIYQKKPYYYHLEKNICVQDIELNAEQLGSPDKTKILEIKKHNLTLIDTNSLQKTQLTTDGKLYYDYASSPETNTRAITQRLEGHKLEPIAIWSPDSQKIVTHKLDQRRVRPLYLLQNSPSKGHRPIAHKYKMSFSGDANLPLAELTIIDVKTKNILTVQVEPLLSPYLTPLEFQWVLVE